MNSMKQHNGKWQVTVSGLLLSCLLMAGGWSRADDADGFQAWLVGVHQEAIDLQIAPAAVDATLSQVTYLPRVIELDRKQPEFVTSFSAYVNRRINPRVVGKGKQMMQDYQAYSMWSKSYTRCPGRCWWPFGGWKLILAGLWVIFRWPPH
jgi:membrane-bound lytic murein transglycosylase B